MKRNQIGCIIIHGAENADFSALSYKISAFHVQIIERRLSKLPLTPEQKIAVIDKIIENLKSRET